MNKKIVMVYGIERPLYRLILKLKGISYEVVNVEEAIGALDLMLLKAKYGNAHPKKGFLVNEEDTKRIPGCRRF